MESAMNIAKYIVTKCMNDEIPINNTQLQKILYIVQITFLKELGKPLFVENFEAWRLGPVIPDVYYSFCGWGVMKICNKYAFDEIAANKRDLIDLVVTTYRTLSVAEIVKLTQSNRGAWRKVYGKGEGLRVKIPLELMKELSCSGK